MLPARPVTFLQLRPPHEHSRATATGRRPPSFFATPSPQLLTRPLPPRATCQGPLTPWYGVHSSQSPHIPCILSYTLVASNHRGQPRSCHTTEHAAPPCRRRPTSSRNHSVAPNAAKLRIHLRHIASNSSRSTRVPTAASSAAATSTPVHSCELGRAARPCTPAGERPVL